MNVETALGRYLAIVDSVAPGLVEGLYVVGSYALDDWVEGYSDIDIVAVTAEPATEDDFGSLRTVHALLAEQQPTPAIDGPYLAWGDLVVEPATGLHRPWTLDGDLHHDADCFEINPITWYTLATSGVTVRGPAPQTLGIPTDVEARIRFVVGNLQGYWAEVTNQVAVACEHDEPRHWAADTFVWCALGALRLHHTAFTGEVVSKRGAGEYGLRVAPGEFHDTLRAALAMRAEGNRGDVTPSLMRVAAAIMAWCITDVGAAVR
ncbi:MAG: nucleotidyltransferase domain-containing protein [Actinomycetota bacterium]|nr:nucleotidyltransferase domain-containing protein [Actinomycetota bacterium]